MLGFLRVPHPVAEFPHLIETAGEPAVRSPLAKHPDPTGQVQPSLRGYIAQAQQPPRRPVWLVAFDQEEWGMVGSEVLATELKASGQPLKLMVSLEMLAFTSAEHAYPHPAMRQVDGCTGDFIALVANRSAGLMLPGLSAAMGRHVKTKVLPVPNRAAAMPDVRLSDHSPLWDQGYNALMVTDTSYMRSPHCRQMSDTVDTLDLPFICQVVNGLDAALSRLRGSACVRGSPTLGARLTSLSASSDTGSRRNSATLMARLLTNNLFLIPLVHYVVDINPSCTIPTWDQGVSAIPATGPWF